MTCLFAVLVETSVKSDFCSLHSVPKYFSVTRVKNKKNSRYTESEIQKNAETQETKINSSCVNEQKHQNHGTNQIKKLCKEK